MYACRYTLLFLLLAFSSTTAAEPLSLNVKQITYGPHHHFFGYIGQSLTIPWNASGRYILSLRTTFHDHMPTAKEAAEIVLIDTQKNNRVTPIEKTLAWNFQQGTMFYWHPKHPETQFFFNDRDPNTNRIFTVLFDIEQKKRIREYRFTDASIANGGVAPTGEFFLAINYGRMARLRPVTGYPDTADPTAAEYAPTNDGIFRVDVDTGNHTLLVSFHQLRDLLKNRYKNIDHVQFYINHSLSNRTGEYVYFYARARFENESMHVNIPCSIKTDGTHLTAHKFIGGHPEWDKGTVVIGAHKNHQVRYDILQQKIIGHIANPKIIPKPGADISLSPDANWFACGYGTSNGQNQYVIVRRSDNSFAFSPLFSRGPYTRGELRIDPAPRWNRNQSALLIPAFTKDGTRQLHLLEINTL